MKRIALFVILALIVAPAVFAGDYHKQTTLICADCHVMHYSQSHGYNPDGTGLYTPLGADGPYHYLLRNDINDLCLTCHDGSSTYPDVLGANSVSGIVRLAGALNRSGADPYFHTTGHTLDSTDPAPGGTYSNPDGLHCADCHKVHGSTVAYRNLGRYSAPTWSDITYAVGTNDTSKDIFERSAAMGGDHYDWDNVDWNEPDETVSKYADMCKGCHTNFHGAKGGPEVGGATGEEWLRHPNADANIGAVGGGHSTLSVFQSKTNRVKVLSHAGVWDPPGADVTPSCMSCHKAHGNQNSFGLIHMLGTGTITEQGDDPTATPKQTCKQCHRQG